MFTKSHLIQTFSEKKSQLKHEKYQRNGNLTNVINNFKLRVHIYAKSEQNSISGVKAYS